MCIIRGSCPIRVEEGVGNEKGEANREEEEEVERGGKERGRLKGKEKERYKHR